MKKNLLLFLTTSCFFLLLAISISHSRNEENRVYSKSSHLGLRATPEPTGKKVAEADRNEALSIIETKGVWYKVAGKNGEGWVYSGTVSTEELPKENKNEMMGASAGLTAANSATGLDGAAEKYADAHDLSEVVEQFKWAEQINKKVSQDEARDYLKSHKLGEFAEAK
jgi:hypothetical protein